MFKMGLPVNLNKTKTMVFQKKNKQANKYTFKNNGNVVENVLMELKPPVPVTFRRELIGK